MNELLLSLVVFFAAHLVPALKPLRAALVRVMGERAYLVFYSLVTVGLLVWVGVAFARAEYVELWPYQRWAADAAVVLMLPVCVLLVAGITNPNPFSVFAPRDGFDADRPGIVAVTRHPVLWALSGWAALHLLANNDLAAWILFAVLAGLGLAGVPSLDAKRRSQMGDDAWRELAASTSNMPFAAMIAGRTRLRLRDVGWQGIVFGIALYGAALLGHEKLIGVAPIWWLP